MTESECSSPDIEILEPDEDLEPEDVDQNGQASSTVLLSDSWRDLFSRPFYTASTPETIWPENLTTPPTKPRKRRLAGTLRTIFYPYFRQTLALQYPGQFIATKEILNMARFAYKSMSEEGRRPFLEEYEKLKEEVKRGKEQEQGGKEPSTPQPAKQQKKYRIRGACQMFFFPRFRKDLKRLNPERKFKPGEIDQIGRKVWNKMTAAQQKPFYDQLDEYKKRYMAEEEEKKKKKEDERRGEEELREHQKDVEIITID